MNALEEALGSALAHGTALIGLLGGTAIYNSQAPRDAQRPYVVFSLASGIEENLTPRDSQRMVYLVKGVADSLYNAGQIADEINHLLHGATLTVGGATNFWTARETVVRYQEIDPAGHAIGHAGGEYVIRLEEA